MYELSGTIKDATVDLHNGNVVLSLSINEKQSAKSCFDELCRVEKLSVKIDKYREKRSLNANNYAWKLITEIGNTIRASKEEVYLTMLKHYGQSEIVSVLSHIPIKEYVKYSEEAGETVLYGKPFKHYRIFKGSSEFDSREMAIFIDGIVSEAKELGIETKTPEEIENLKNLWETQNY